MLVLAVLVHMLKYAQMEHGPRCYRGVGALPGRAAGGARWVGSRRRPYEHPRAR